jgi:hypothetical protein
MLKGSFWYSKKKKMWGATIIQVLSFRLVPVIVRCAENFASSSNTQGCIRGESLQNLYQEGLVTPE